MWVYRTKGILGETCTLENIFDFISERKQEWTIGMRRNGVDICTRYKMLMGKAIPKLARREKILEESMNASIAREVKSKYNADPIPPKNLSAECPHVAPAREMPVAEEPSSKMPAAEEPYSQKSALLCFFCRLRNK